MGSASLGITWWWSDDSSGVDRGPANLRHLSMKFSVLQTPLVGPFFAFILGAAGALSL